MKIERENLDNLVTIAISDLHKNKILKNRITEIARYELKKHFMYNKIIQLINKNTLVSSLTEKELYNFSNFMITHDLLKDVNLSDYYTDTEINEAINDTPIEGYDNSNGVIFNNMIYNNNEIKPQFLGFISYQELAKMHESRVFTYNLATQRIPTTINIRNRFEEIATVNQKSVDSICESVLNGTFEENMITLNIRLGAGERYVYKDSDKTLYIPLGVELDEIDGHHRISGIHKAWLKNKDIKGTMAIMIKHLSTSQAREFIRQETKGNANSKDEIEIYNSNTNMYKLIDEINRYSNQNNLFFNKISIDEEVNDPIVFYQIFATEMYNSWNEVLVKTNSKDIFKMRNFICDFYSIVYDTFMEKFKVNNLNELKNKDVMNQTFLSGLLYPCHDLYLKCNGEIDIGEIDKLIGKINLDNISDYTYENSKWKSIVNKYRRKWKSLVK